jgi:hypothetical protein
MRRKSGPEKEPGEQVVKEIRRATRRQFSAEEKIRIVLSSLRGEDSIAELCRREGKSADSWCGKFTASCRKTWRSDLVPHPRCDLLAAIGEGPDDDGQQHLQWLALRGYMARPLKWMTKARRRRRPRPSGCRRAGSRRVRARSRMVKSPASSTICIRSPVSRHPAQFAAR